MTKYETTTQLDKRMRDAKRCLFLGLIPLALFFSNCNSYAETMYVVDSFKIVLGRRAGEKDKIVARLFFKERVKLLSFSSRLHSHLDCLEIRVGGKGIN